MRLLTVVPLAALLGLATAAAPQAPRPCAQVLGGPAEPVKPNAGHPELEAQVIALTNRVRAQGCTCPNGEGFPAAGALGPNAELRAAAVAHSQDMARNDFFGHESPTRGGLRARIDRTAYRWRTIGENLAAGPRTPLQVMRGWLESPGHCTTLMAARFREIGVALVNDPNDTSEVDVGGGRKAGPFRTYWTQEFAAPL